MYTPLIPHFYIVKLGFTGVYLFFLFLLQNIDSGYSFKLPRRGASNVYNVLSNHIKIIKIFQMKFSIFNGEKKSLYIAWVCFRNDVSGF